MCKWLLTIQLFRQQLQYALSDIHCNKMKGPLNIYKLKLKVMTTKISTI